MKVKYCKFQAFHVCTDLNSMSNDSAEILNVDMCNLPVILFILFFASVKLKFMLLITLLQVNLIKYILKSIPPLALVHANFNFYVVCKG